MAKHKDRIVGTDESETLSGDRHDNIIRGLGGDDIMRGGQGDDRLVDGLGDDQLFGNWGDDVFDIIGGHDAVNGGTGDDLVIVDGNFADWDIQQNGMGNDYTMTRGDQTVTITNVELVQFDDRTVPTEDPGPL